MTNWKVPAARGLLTAAHLLGLGKLTTLAARPMGAIFTLHHVRPDPADATFAPNAHLSITPESLTKTIRHLRSRGVEIVDLPEVVRRLDHGSDRRFAAFTLDDAYRDNLDVAAPVFRAEKTPYTVFVSPGLSDGSVIPWWELAEEAVKARAFVIVPFQTVPLPTKTLAEKKKAFARLLRHFAEDCPEATIPADARSLALSNGIDLAAFSRQILDWPSLRILAEDPLCTIGAHTMTHPRLARLSAEAARDEMALSRDAIEAELGRRPDFFAFPYGSRDACGAREFEIAADLGFAASFTTRLHPLMPALAGARHGLPRLSLNGHFQAPRHVDVLMSGLPGLWKHRRRGSQRGLPL